MKIEQLLHGYNNGHTLITGSIQLKSMKDVSNMALYSDWTEYRDPYGEDSSYLTAYPLEESPYYVISKTWYAREMERPGSVWTHSLLIPINELDIYFDLRNLINFFKKPQIGEYRGYENSIIINGNGYSGNENIYNQFKEIEWLYIYAKLLNLAEPIVLTIEKPSRIYQMMCLTLMQFIPINILRKRSFCTGSAVSRKLGKKIVSLQFVMVGGVSIQKHFKNENLSLVNFNTGLQYVVNAFKDESQEVSGLIRMFSEEIEDSCNKFCAVANLLRLLNNTISLKEREVSYEEVLKYLITDFPLANEGLVLKQTFLSKKISSFFCSEEDFFYTLCTIQDDKAVNIESLKYQERLEKLISNSRDIYINLLFRLSESEKLNTLGKTIIFESPAKLNSSEILLIAENRWNFYLTLILLDSDLLNNTFWINLPRTKFIQILNQFSDKLKSVFIDWKLLFNRVIKEEVILTKQLATDLMNYTPNAVSILMDYLKSSDNHNINEEFLIICRYRIKEILEWMNKQDYLSANIINILINYVDPSSEDVRHSGSEAWLKLLNIDKNQMNIEYYIFLFILSFNWVDDNSFKYLQKSFYFMHESLKNSLLSSNMWIRLIPYTDELPFWQDWDKCKKLRKGIVKYLKNCGYVKSDLKDFTPDMDLNKELKRIW